MQRSKKILITIALTLGIAGAAFAVGKHHYGNPDKRANHIVNYISDELDLDTTQKQALTVLKDSLIHIRKTFRSEMTEIHQDAKSLITADVFDRAQALSLIDTRTARINSVAPEIVGALGDFLDTLNSEQKTRVSNFIDKHNHRRGHRH